MVIDLSRPYLPFSDLRYLQSNLHLYYKSKTVAENNICRNIVIKIYNKSYETLKSYLICEVILNNKFGDDVRILEFKHIVVTTETSKADIISWLKREISTATVYSFSYDR